MGLSAAEAQRSTMASLQPRGSGLPCLRPSGVAAARVFVALAGGLALVLRLPPESPGGGQIMGPLSGGLSAGLYPGLRGAQLGRVPMGPLGRHGGVSVVAVEPWMPAARGRRSPRARD